MKKLLTLIFMALMFCESYAEKITLEEYIYLVQQNNKDLHIAQKNTEKAKTLVSQAFASFLPMVGARAGYTHFQGSVSFSDSFVSSNPILSQYYPMVKDSFDDMNINNASVGLGVEVNILNPQAFGAYRVSKKSFELQREAENYIRKYLVLSAKKLYAQVQLLNDVLFVQQEMQEMYEAVYDSQLKKYNAGTITELDLRMAEVDLKNAALALIQAEKNLNVGFSAFRHLASINSSVEIELEATENFESEQNKHESFSFEVEDALSNRTDYKMALLAKEIADIQLQSSYSTFAPTIIGGVGYGLGKTGGFNESNNFFSLNDLSSDNLAVSVQAVIPLFTGGLRRGLIKEAKANQESSELILEKTKDSIEQELTELAFRFEEVSKRLESAKILELTASRASHLAKTSLNSGLGTQISLSQAESKLAQAKLNYKNAVYEYKAAKYDLDFAMGR